MSDEPVADELRIFAVHGIGEVVAGDDIAELIAATGIALLDSDVVVVTSKIVSKAEGRLVAMDREAAIDAELVRLVAQRGSTRIVQTRHGFVLAAAGVDASNVPAGTVALLPEDPDASALRIKTGLADRLGVDVAVIVTDTMGRPWRNGLTDVCIGAAGLAVLSDLRGNVDSTGHRLDATVTAVADELAAAAELVKGKLGGVPIAVVRGWPAGTDPDAVGARPLIRPADEDMFRLGSKEARIAAVIEPRSALTLSGEPVDLRLIRSVIEAAAAATTATEDWLLIIDEDEPTVLACIDLRAYATAALLGLGAAVERVGILLAAHGMAAVWSDADAVRDSEGLDPWGVVGRLTIGFPEGEFEPWPS